MNASQKLIINGPTTLSGTVSVQGSKNAAMKHVLMPLLSPGAWTFHNVPRIGSIDNLLKITELQGTKVNWTSNNTVVSDSVSVVHSTVIPADLFYYTSGAIFILNILTQRFGHCTLEKQSERTDTGGDQIGSRELSTVCKTLDLLGITTTQTSTTYQFTLRDNNPFEIEIPVRSFSASVNAVIAALFKNGTSIINKPTGEAEFYDTIRLLQHSGAEIELSDDKIIMQGPGQIRPVEFTNMYDRHDFVTFLSAALTTNSHIIITNVTYKDMRLEALTKIMNQMNIELSFEKDNCQVYPQKGKIKGTSILAGLYPNFASEWQVLFSPLFTQISTQTEVIDVVFTNRMQHYVELAKMGANHQFFTHPEYPEKNNQPRSVKVIGPVALHGAEVTAHDVRCGGALLVAALAAQGESIIYNYEHISRGYENIVDRFGHLGTDIRLEKLNDNSKYI